MTTETGLLNVQFPRQLRGYSVIAVEDFVREMGARLDRLQSTIDEQDARIEKLTADLNAANNNLAAFIEKEAAIANAMVAMEQRKVGVEHEIEMLRTNAEAQICDMLAHARTEAASLLTEAERGAQETTTLAEQSRALEEDRLRALCLEHDEAIGRIRRALEAQLAMLPAPGAVLSELSISGVAVTNSVGAAREATEAA